MTTIAIHQPEYFPWLGFLDKARRADVLVLLDDVQFDRSSLQHRAKVAGAGGLVWITIPFVHKFPQDLRDVRVADPDFPVKHWKTLQACYGRAAGWPDAAPRLEPYFVHRPEHLLDATIPSVHLLLEAFGVRTRVVRASTLAARGEKAELVLALCRELGAERYLSGRTGATYLDPERFRREGIEIEVLAYAPPSYARHRPLPEEARGLSALDAWLCLGKKAPTIWETT